MTERIAGEDSISYELGQMLNSTMEPGVRRAISEANLIWEDSIANGEEGIDMRQLILELDDTYWSEHQEKNAYVTGYVRNTEFVSGAYICRSLEGSNGTYVEDRPCRWIGFTAMEDSDKDKHSLKLLFAADMTGEYGEQFTGFFVMDTNSIVDFYGGSPSIEHASAVMERYTPQLVESIDEAIFSSNGEIGDAIIRLRDLDCSELLELHSKDRHVCRKVAYILDSYINSITNLDTEVPYLIDYDGPVYLDHRQRKLQFDIPEIILNMKSFSFEIITNSQGDTRAALGIEGRFLVDDSDYDQEVVMLVDGMQSAVSLRDFIYR